jgi:hypothetical protein
MRFPCFTVYFLEVTLHNKQNKNTALQGVSVKIFEPNMSVICQRIFMKFKMQIF